MTDRQKVELDIWVVLLQSKQIPSNNPYFAAPLVEFIAAHILRADGLRADPERMAKVEATR